MFTRFAVCLVVTTSLSSVAFAQASQPPAKSGIEEIVVVGTRIATLGLNETADTTSRLGVPVFQLPLSASVISGDLMLDRGITTALDAVTQAVGMTGGTSLGGTPRFASRGFSANSNNITVMRDGIRQNSLAQSARTLDAFNLERIEVLKGPASVLYGEGAIAGAINYVSKEPNREFRSNGILSYGSWDSVRLGVGAGGPVVPGKVFFRADASHSRSDGYVDRTDFDRTSLTGAVEVIASDTFSAKLNLDYLTDDISPYFGTPLIYDSVKRVDGSIAVTTPNLAAGDILVNPRIDDRTRKINYNITDGFSEADYVFGRLTLTWKPTSSLDVRLMPYVATQDQDYRNSEGFTFLPATRLIQRDALGFIYRDDILYGARADAKWTTALFGDRKSIVTFGTDISRNDQTRGTRPNVPAAATQIPNVDPFQPALSPGPNIRFAENAQALVDIAALYSEALVEASDRFSLIAGLRFDSIDLKRVTLPSGTAADYERGYNPLTGRGGIVFKATPNVNLYASYTRAVEPVVQLVSQTATARDFGLVKGEQIEVGLKSRFWDGRAETTVAVYDIVKNDILTSSVVNGLRIQQQIGEQRAQGIEVAAAIIPAPDWRIEANTAYTDAKFGDFNDNLGTGVISRRGNRPDNVPEWSANVFATKTFSNGIRVQGGLQHVGQRWGNVANTLNLKSYTTLDASVSYDWRNYTIALRADNLTDQQFVDWQVFQNTPYAKLSDPRSVTFEIQARF
jgi:iron complex outermembrane recepter protein